MLETDDVTELSDGDILLFTFQNDPQSSANVSMRPWHDHCAILCKGPKAGLEGSNLLVHVLYCGAIISELESYIKNHTNIHITIIRFEEFFRRMMLEQALTILGSCKLKGERLCSNNISYDFSTYIEFDVKSKKSAASEGTTSGFFYQALKSNASSKDYTMMYFQMAMQFAGFHGIAPKGQIPCAQLILFSLVFPGIKECFSKDERKHTKDEENAMITRYMNMDKKKLEAMREDSEDKEEALPAIYDMPNVDLSNFRNKLGHFAQLNPKTVTPENLYHFLLEYFSNEIEMHAKLSKLQLITLLQENAEFTQPRHRI